MKLPELKEIPLSEKAKEFHKNCNHTKPAMGNSFIYQPPEGCTVIAIEDTGYVFNEKWRNF